MKLHRSLWRRASFSVLGLALVLLFAWPGVIPLPFKGLPGMVAAAERPNRDVQASLAAGRDSFNRGQLPVAAETLETALDQAQVHQDALGEVMVLSNLALVYGQQGRWREANGAIARSLDLLEQAPADDRNWQQVKAQTLNVQGRLQLGQGHADSAFTIWGEAATAYELAGAEAGALRSQLRQARALQAQGFYRRAVDEILEPLRLQLLDAPSSPVKAASLRELAEAMKVALTLQDAQAVAMESLAVAQELTLPDEIAATQLTLGNIAYAQALEYTNQNSLAKAEAAATEALQWYDQVADASEAQANRMRSQLNQLALLVDFGRTDEAMQHWRPVYDQVNTIAPDQEGIYMRINLANSLESILVSDGDQAGSKQASDAPTWDVVLSLLKTAQTQAIALQDIRAEAHALGYLGKAYKLKGELETDREQLEAAQKLTEEALFAAETVNAIDISYRWYEQLGDLHQHLGEKTAAIAAYRGAVNALKSLRKDLVTINPEVQFSFQKDIEPLHRRLVSLLLEGDAQPSQANLKDARAVLESLQVEELNNYLRAACINGQEVSVDDISGDQRVAVIYPIILPDRLGIIANLPGSSEQALKADGDTLGDLQYYTSALEEGQLEDYADTMLFQLIFVDYDVLNTAQKLYELLFPVELQQALERSQANTLVFIPDGILRNIPISALFDGQSYLIEKYSVAITPGLQLLNPKPLQERKLTALTFGLTEAVADWSPLPNVADEIEAIKAQIEAESFLNQQFTREQFEDTMGRSSAPIIHLATHGRFSSQLDQTFIQAYDDQISVDDLSSWLRGDRTEPIELLVLSACETATGDQRAALGLAGMAIRAGARSTVASLWQVDDAATAIFMTRFYEELSAKSGNKAEALQNAQTYLLKEFRADFGHPYYWAPFVLIGNWL